MRILRHAKGDGSSGIRPPCRYFGRARDPRSSATLSSLVPPPGRLKRLCRFHTQAYRWRVPSPVPHSRRRRSEVWFSIWLFRSELRGARRRDSPLRKSRFVLADVFRYISRQSKPALTVVMLRNVFEKILIQLGSVFRRTPSTIEIHVVGMNDHQR